MRRPDGPSGRLIAVVGATATGKTALAVSIARAVGGEIINADSRQVYRGMDIGTAKPTREEQAAVRHWLIDCAAPGEQFTLAAFLDAAHAALGDIAARGLMPVVAGGTGQYVWALIEGWRVPRVPPDPALRAELQALAAREGAAAVVSVLRAEDPASADGIDPRNVRRIVRAIEVTRATGRPFSAWREKAGPPAEDVRIIGLDLPREALYARIDARVDAMLAAGLVDEVRGLIAAGYGCELPSMSGIGYRQICAHLRGEMRLDAAAAEIKTETHRLARMQHTWFRRDDPRIHWLDASAPDLNLSALAAAGVPA
ncbi:MAG: tRNA (adenosine(37)-N6)-dimethylallyltransferase MiaA [Chloroflexota bacterium]|nr:tRNA (adenosine(37)-N6)-dimethylallyltransferase MiaA [Chloroflexota bacterium]